MSVVGSPVGDVDEEMYDPGWLEQARTSAETELQAALRDRGVDATGRVSAGTVADELADLSAHVDLLVVGSRGWGPVRRILLGSTSARLMREAHCPVLVLPRGAATGEPGERDPSTGAHGETPAVA